MNHVVCVKWGNKYISKYANVLKNMVQRNCTVDYQFHCITDDPNGLDPDINVIRFPSHPGIKTWWSKLWMFSADFPLQGNILYFDLDVVVFDKTSLETTAIEQYAKDYSPQISTAHPIRDYKRNTLVNVGIKFGYKTQYMILETDLASGKCQCIARYFSNIPFYHHSFAMTENYVILYQTPVVISRRKALSPWRPISDAMAIKPELGSKIIVINRHNGESTVFTPDSFYCFHSSNAYEKNHEIVLDLVTTHRGDYGLFSLDIAHFQLQFQLRW